MYQRQVAVLIALITLLPLHLMKAETGETTGTPWVGDVGATRTTGELMDDQTLQDLTSGPVSKPARRRGRFPHRQHLANAPKSPVAAGWSDSTGVLRTSIPAAGPTKPHVAEFSSLATPPSPLNFTGATLPDCRSYPPDTMGAVGPSQFLVVLNGRIRVFDKKTGVKGSLDLDLDVFFQSVRSSNYTTDPRVRYDRMSGRWIIICITDASADNKVLLAVSNNGTITSSTVWTYFSFVQSAITPAGDKGDFADYPTLGVDANALYVGASIFTASGNFVGASAFVIRRSSVLGAGPIVVTAFRNLTGGDPYGAGPALPQGVDNYDPAATVGYFIGTDNASFGNLILRRVSNPGGTPTISGNINITVPSTAYPISVPHKGNNDLSNGVLDSIDDRLMAAHLRNGSLWTSHQIGVDNTGVSDASAVTRNGVRWYQLGNLTGTPDVTQSGTLFAATGSNVTTDLNYWMGTIMVSGQGHAALGCSSAGTNAYVNAVAAQRFATDAPGTLQPPAAYTASTTAYNPPGDTGGPRRWGDYSMTTVDPSDDMTMWTIQEFCSSTNNYGVRVLQINAPPPATPASCVPPSVTSGTSNTTIVLTGTSTAGSGFFDPGTGFAGRITASVSGTGVTVNSITYTDPTHVTLHLTTAAGALQGTRTVTITNPDGQSSAASVLDVVAPSTNANLASLTVSAGVLSPVFATATMNYTDAVDYATTSITVTPTTADATATIKVNGIAITSGRASSAISLSVGDNIINTVVTAQDGTTTRQYTVTVTRTLTTSGKPTWNRPDENGSAAPVALSSSATAVPYDVYHFTVSSAGVYNITCTGTNPANWDTYLFLYSGAFDPQMPLNGAVIGNDNAPSIGTSGFSATLQTGTDYFLVTTGHDNSSLGGYALEIQGAGTATRQAPTIAVEYPAGTGLVNGASSVNFSTVHSGSSNTLTFIIKNKGNVNLTSLVTTVDGAASADYAVTTPLSTTLASNTGTTFTVKFSPTADGVRSATLHIASNDLDENPFDIGLTGIGFVKPSITLPPASLLVGTGESASFSVSASGSGTLTYKWLKNNLAITGATSTTYSIASAALTSAGSYSATVTNILGPVTSSAAKLGVVSLATSSVTVNEGLTIALTAHAAAPAGTILTYQWMKDHSPLSNSGTSPGQIISGATATTLNITKAATLNAGSYTCVVGMGGLTKECGAFTVAVRLKPVVDPLGPLAWTVSGTVTDLATAQNLPTKFVFSGLPPGVTGNATTGQLSGKPTTAITASKTFSITASNLAGTSPPVIVSYTITPLPLPVVGTFNGLLDRDMTLSAPFAIPTGQKLQGMGGSLTSFVVASTGAFTGTLKLEDKSYAMPVGSRLDAVSGSSPTCTVTLVRGTKTDAIADLTFSFSIDQNTGELTGTVTDGLGSSTAIPVLAWRNQWKTTGTLANPANPATALAGRYTAVLDLDPTVIGYSSHPDIPQGRGYLVLTVTTAGGVTWSGKLADGVAVSGSTTLGPGGQLPLHMMLYTPTVAATAGSVHGWAQATTDTVLPLQNGGHPLLDGTVDWKKLEQTSTTRSYKAGFALHNLTVIGGVYALPPANTPVIGLNGVGTGNNAKLVFSEGDLASSTLAGPGSPQGSISGTLNQALRITTTNAVVMPTGSTSGVANNPGSVTLTLTAGTGLISGNFTLTKDNDPTDTTFPYTVITRSVPWSGVLVPRLSKGMGQFQLPQLPAVAVPPSTINTTTATSPILSGEAILETGP